MQFIPWWCLIHWVLLGPFWIAICRLRVQVFFLLLETYLRRPPISPTDLPLLSNCCSKWAGNIFQRDTCLLHPCFAILFIFYNIILIYYIIILFYGWKSFNLHYVLSHNLLDFLTVNKKILYSYWQQWLHKRLSTSYWTVWKYFMQVL